MLGTGTALEASSGALIDIVIASEGRGCASLSAPSDLDAVITACFDSGSAIDCKSGGIREDVGTLLCCKGRDAAGEGGGSTNAGAKTGGCGCDKAMLILNAGICNAEDGITSVSNGGITFLGEVSPGPTPDERLETRIFFPVPTLPTGMAALLDLWGDR